MKNSIIKNSRIYLLLIIILPLILSACVNMKPAEKSACEASGGEYTQGVGDSGVFYYCKCPISKYETSSKTCSEITGDIIDKCVELSNEFIKCEHSKEYNEYYAEGICECIIQSSNQKTYLTYQNILECTCKCFEEDCNCMCQAYKNGGN